MADNICEFEVDEFNWNVELDWAQRPTAEQAITELVNDMNDNLEEVSLGEVFNQFVDEVQCVNYISGQVDVEQTLTGWKVTLVNGIVKATCKLVSKL